MASRELLPGAIGHKNIVIELQDSPLHHGVESDAGFSRSSSIISSIDGHGVSMSHNAAPSVSTVLSRHSALLEHDIH